MPKTHLDWTIQKQVHQHAVAVPDLPQTPPAPPVLSELFQPSRRLLQLSFPDLKGSRQSRYHKQPCHHLPLMPKTHLDWTIQKQVHQHAVAVPDLPQTPPAPPVLSELFQPSRRLLQLSLADLKGSSQSRYHKQPCHHLPLMPKTHLDWTIQKQVHQHAVRA